MNKHVVLASYLAFGLSAAAGCGREYEQLETGEVALRWVVGPRGCEEASADAVEVEQVDEGGVAVGPRWRFACEARFGIIDGLEPAAYRFVLRAVTPEGRATFMGDTGAVAVRPGGVTEPPPVVMEATPGRLTVEWNFGGPLCAQAGAATVEVLAFDPWGTIEASRVQSCETGAASLVMRPGPYDVVVHALSVEGMPTHEYIFPVELDRGDDLFERVRLEPASN
jgi:hypothetical protein